MEIKRNITTAIPTAYMWAKRLYLIRGLGGGFDEFPPSETKVGGRLLKTLILKG